VTGLPLFTIAAAPLSTGGFSAKRRSRDGALQSALDELVFSEKDSDPTSQRHPVARSVGLRHKSIVAQAMNHSGRRTTISEQCKISQTTQIKARRIIVTMTRNHPIWAGISYQIFVAMMSNTRHLPVARNENGKIGRLRRRDESRVNTI